MARIIIENLYGKVLEVTPEKTLLRHFHDHRIDWMHACGGKGRCTTCKVRVIQGLEYFSVPSAAELRYRAQGALANNERLSCQSTVSGNVTVCAPDEYKLPHLQYSA